MVDSEVGAAISWTPAPIHSIKRTEHYERNFRIEIFSAYMLFNLICLLELSAIKLGIFHPLHTAQTGSSSNEGSLQVWETLMKLCCPLYMRLRLAVERYVFGTPRFKKTVFSVEHWLEKQPRDRTPLKYQKASFSKIVWSLISRPSFSRYD